MDEREVRLRCIEAASKAPMVHQTGPAVGVLEVARVWAGAAARGTGSTTVIPFLKSVRDETAASAAA